MWASCFAVYSCARQGEKRRSEAAECKAGRRAAHTRTQSRRATYPRVLVDPRLRVVLRQVVRLEERVHVVHVRQRPKVGELLQVGLERLEVELHLRAAFRGHLGVRMSGRMAAPRQRGGLAGGRAALRTAAHLFGAAVALHERLDRKRDGAAPQQLRDLGGQRLKPAAPRDPPVISYEPCETRSRFGAAAAGEAVPGVRLQAALELDKLLHERVDVRAGVRADLPHVPVDLFDLRNGAVELQRAHHRHAWPRAG